MGNPDPAWPGFMTREEWDRKVAEIEGGGRKRRLAYWLTVGWLWEPTKWAGRVGLWLVFWPVGLWRSIVHGQDKRARKAAR